VCACVRACVCACVRACVRVRVCACVHECKPMLIKNGYKFTSYSMFFIGLFYTLKLQFLIVFREAVTTMNQITRLVQFSEIQCNLL
jgi:hypothetical protein